MGHVFVLALIASLSPTLATATTVMLLLDRPVRLMTGYLLGAYTASITIGLVVVFALGGDASTTTTTRDTVSPAVTLTFGALALLAAFMLHTGRAGEIAELR